MEKGSKVLRKKGKRAYPMSGPLVLALVLSLWSYWG